VDYPIAYREVFQVPIFSVRINDGNIGDLCLDMHNLYDGFQMTEKVERGDS